MNQIKILKKAPIHMLNLTRFIEMLDMFYTMDMRLSQHISAVWSIQSWGESNLECRIVSYSFQIF